MKSNHLGPEQVLAVLDAAGDLNAVLSRILDDPVGAPRSAAKTLVLNLEPRQTAS